MQREDGRKDAGKRLPPTSQGESPHQVPPSGTSEGTSPADTLTLDVVLQNGHRKHLLSKPLSPSVALFLVIPGNSGSVDGVMVFFCGS